MCAFVLGMWVVSFTDSLPLSGYSYGHFRHFGASGIILRMSRELLEVSHFGYHAHRVDLY